MSLNMNSTLEEVIQALLAEYKGKHFDWWTGYYCTIKNSNKEGQLNFFREYVEDMIRKANVGSLTYLHVNGASNKIQFCVGYNGPSFLGLKFKRRRDTLTNAGGHTYTALVLEDISLTEGKYTDTLLDVCNNIATYLDEKRKSNVNEAEDLLRNLNSHGFSSGNEFEQFYNNYLNISKEIRDLIK